MSMTTVPWGLLFFAWCTLMAVAPMRRPRRLATISWISSLALNEVPYLFLYIVVASTVPTIVDGEVGGLGSWISLAIATLTVAGLIVVARRALRTGTVVERALADGLGRSWRSQLSPDAANGLRRHLPWPRILFLPWMFGRHDVERVANIAYGDDGSSNLLDVYRHRSHPTGSPTLLYLHGGGFHWGHKNREARPLLYHLASQGWTCISANYYLASPAADSFPRNLIDVKKLIAWVRAHGHEYGADPDTIFLVGASAGAHLTATAALTTNDPTFQPGFEDADTSFTAGIGLYGYYGTLGGDEHPPTTPLAYDGDPPPFFVVHGDQDTYAPVEGARALAEHLRAVSPEPVVYAELPGAQHSFDLFHSVRFETVVDAIEAFAAWVRSPDSSRFKEAARHD
jgi:acetyl esterase/lipase